jgi:hypothetical protein
MILSAAQPYFAPYPGFFEKMLKSDVFVLLDTVQFPRGGTWMTRNRFKNDQGTLWIRVPVHRKGLGLQRIDRVRRLRDPNQIRKQLSGIASAYRHAPFFTDHFGALKAALESATESLAELNISLIRYAARQLGVRSRVVRLSETDAGLKGAALPADLCRRYGADTFLAQSHARKYLERRPLDAEGVRVLFFRPRTCVYPQLWGGFVANLSIFDLLFCCGPKAGTVIEAPLEPVDGKG